MEYSVSEIAAICGGTFCGEDVTVRSVMADSRRSVARDGAALFVAIRGRNHDGHDHIGELYRRGVRGFMVEREVDASAWPGAGFVRVNKSLAGLQALAAHYRLSFSGTVVGITGSSGKTTVKEWIAQAAPEGVSLFRSPRSYNSQLGVPLSILMMTGNEDIALIEAGISRPGEMDRLAAIIRPDVGVFTHLGPEHGENFQSDRQKMREKAQLFATCRSIVYCGGEPLIEEALRAKAPEAELRDALPYECLLPEEGEDGVARRNKALVTAFYDAVGVPPATVVPKLSELQPVAVRLGMREGIAGSIIVTDMNNTDANSLPMALDYLTGVAGSREKVLIMSDIPFSPMPDWELYGKVGAMVRSAGIGRFVGVGERISACRDAFGAGSEFYRTAEEFIRHCTQDSIAGRAILLRGNSDTGVIRILHQLDRRSHTTVLEVDLDAMRHNLNHYRALVGDGVKMMAMVKASCYGNGNFEVADMLDKQGVNYLAVAFADEGVTLREKGIAMPIVVLNADSDSFALMVANRLEPEIYNFRSLERFIAAVRDAGETSWPVHIKIDTGMHRLGTGWDDAASLRELYACSHLQVKGLFTHLAASETCSPSDQACTQAQIRRFWHAVETLSGAGLPIGALHIQSSYGLLNYGPLEGCGWVRTGIALYGLLSAPQDHPRICPDLRPVLALRARVAQIHTLEPGEHAGYDGAFTASRPTRLALITIGYADGWPRALSCGRGRVLLHGQPAPIAGLICMDQLLADVTEIPDVRPGDTATLIGRDGDAVLTAEAAAEAAGTITNELLSRLGPRLPRIVGSEA